MKHFHGLILAGGRGTRFWPLSRRAHAKQVLRLFGERSLIQQTVDRLKPVLPPENIWVLTNGHLRAAIVRQLPEVPKRQILAEPAQRNTAPAIGLAAQILHGIDPEAVLGVFPSDHVIAKPGRYVRLLRPAIRAAREGKIALLGIQPRWAETGYGYIEFPKGTEPGGEAIPIRRFREKPPERVAKRYLRAGNFYWNAGMFFFRTSVLLAALRRHQPKTASLLASLPPFESRGFGGRLVECFPHCTNISIDHAIMEPMSRQPGAVAGVPAGDIGWNDVGSWDAVYELERRDGRGNAARTAVLIEDSSRNLVEARGKLVALLGVHDLVVVDAGDALLIADRKRSQEVGELVKALEKAGREELL